MRWKDVPMPRQIAALHRDRRGFPVPWISDWSSNQEKPSLVEGDRRFGAWLGKCPHVDGEGEPNLGALCPTRQIKGMIERRCDVCGDHMPKRLYWMGNQELVTSGYRECPLHLDCLLYSGQVCPGMTTKPEGKIWVAASDTMILHQTRMYADGERTFVDDSWRVYDQLGVKSVLVGMVAIPDGNVESWPLEEFLQMHGLQHPYRKVTT